MRNYVEVTYPQIRRANGKLCIRATLSTPRSDAVIDDMNLAYVDVRHEIDDVGLQVMTYHIAG
jgi:hypothetical protein